MSKPGFIRALGLGDATLLVIGGMVGVGIFRTASSIGAHLSSPALILLLWFFGGILSLCGALCYAELAGMFPDSGGDYVYMTKVYGRFWGFLFGWAKLFVERTGTIAILGFVFAEYASRVIPMEGAALRWLAAGAIVLLTTVNIIGVHWGKTVQNAFTILKIVALVAIIAAGVWAVVHRHTVEVDWELPLIDLRTMQSLGVALIFVLWTYGGWTEAAYVAEEVRQPTRNVPRAIVRGVLLVTVLYVLVNWSYLVFIPMEALPVTPLVASSVMERVWGNAGAMFISLMVACSAFGALNGYILTGGRILYAIGKDHTLFTRLGSLHPTFRTPLLALVVNAEIATGLVFTKTFDQIMTYSTLVISVFFTMAVFGVMVLRRTHPDHPRPFVTWGYPVTPLLFGLTMIGFMADVCIKQPVESVFGFGVLALGLPLYGWSRAVSRTS